MIFTRITKFTVDARGLWINNTPEYYIANKESNKTIRNQFMDKLPSCSTLCVGRNLGSDSSDTKTIIYPCNYVRVYRSDISKRQT